MHNPFTREIPFSPNLFVGRKREAWGILDRLANPLSRVSSAIYGEIGIGKSWLLKSLEQPDLLATWELDESEITIVSLDCTEVQTQMPEQFWQKILSQLQSKNIPSSEREIVVEILGLSRVDHFLISQLLDQIGKNSRFLVLFLDNFESIINQLDVDNPSFLNVMRSFLVRKYRGLGIVLTTIEPLNQLCTSRFHFDVSPFDNVFYPVELKPLNKDEAESFLAVRLKETEIGFTEIERQDLFERSQGHPDRLRELGYKLFQNKLESLTS